MGNRTPGTTFYGSAVPVPGVGAGAAKVLGASRRAASKEPTGADRENPFHRGRPSQQQQAQQTYMVYPPSNNTPLEEETGNPPGQAVVVSGGDVQMVQMHH